MTPATRRRLLLQGADVVVDIGANEGQYANWLRELGFAGEIHSFEPLPVTFRKLCTNAANDPRWHVHNMALGDEDAEADMHTSSDAAANSLLYPTAAQVSTCHPPSWPDGHERVTVRRLEGIWGELEIKDELRVHMKVDVEGHELAVLRGAADLLPKIALVELEISIAPMFEGGPLLPDVVAFLTGRGFDIVALEPNGGVDASTGQMLMMDGVFRRRARPTAPPDGARAVASVVAGGAPGS